MISNTLSSILTVTAIGLNTLASNISNLGVNSTQTLATHQISLEQRQEDQFVNSVFKDNILLSLGYLKGSINDSKKIDWNEVKKPFTYQFKLNPGESFAFHDDILDRYKISTVKTTNSHFNSAEGYKYDGYLIGDGVCHLASLIYWVAKDAKLNTLAPTNHDFAKINQIPKEYGVAIFDQNIKGTSFNQNLYITNNLKNTIAFEFKYDGTNLTVSALSFFN